MVCYGGVEHAMDFLREKTTISSKNEDFHVEGRNICYVLRKEVLFLTPQKEYKNVSGVKETTSTDNHKLVS